MPQLEEMKRHEEEHGFKLFLIDAKGMIGSTKKILAEKEIIVPLLIDSGFYSRRVLEVMYTPTIVIIDGEGRLRARLVGVSKDMEDLILDILDRLGSESRDLAHTY